MANNDLILHSLALILKHLEWDESEDEEELRAVRKNIEFELRGPEEFHVKIQAINSPHISEH